MTQNEAVYMAVRSVFGELDTIPETGKWSEQQKEGVYSALMKTFKAGEWVKNSGGTDDAALMKYIPGLVNNHVRKDTRLNGGTKYETKRPGSRAGTGDEMVREMRKLQSIQSDPAAKQQIQVAIDERLAQIKPKTEIVVANLPESLRHLVPQS